MRKAQSSVEFIIIILFYLIVTVVLVVAVLRLMPSELGKAKEQQACSQAELLASSLFKFEGNETTWAGGNLYELGFSAGGQMEINYTKWGAAQLRGYYNVSTDADISMPFYLRYTAYAINWSSDATPTMPNETETGSVYLVRQDENLVVYAGANSTPFDFRLKLFFPFTSVVDSSCTGALEVGDTNATSERNAGNETTLDWYVGANDLDCINLTAGATPEIVFIREIHENSTSDKTIFVYLGTHTILNNNFGSTGYIDNSKSFCAVERVGLVENNNELIPVRLQVISWR